MTGQERAAGLIFPLKQAMDDFRTRWRETPQRRRVPAAHWDWVLLGSVLAIAAAGSLDRQEVLSAASLPPIWRDVAEVVTRLGLSGYIFATSAITLLACLALRERSRTAMRRAMYSALAGRAFFVFAVNFVSGVGSQILKHGVGRARPQLMALLGPYHFDFLSIKATLASFPSGHAVTAFATAAALASFTKHFKSLFYVTAISVGLSRLFILAHYPSDVIAGALLGWCSTEWLARSFAARRIVYDWRGGRIRLRAAGIVSRLLATPAAEWR